jgi:glycosyltransferase involved in cell wall biosynthesis
MKPLVSVLVAAYNAAAWLTETLDSVSQQTWGNIEIIVVDDGSKDETLSIAKQYESSTIKVIYQENQGASAARNRGLELAQGDFIQYLDADDLLAPDKIERQLTFWQSGSKNRVISGEWARFVASPDEAIFEPNSLWQDRSPVDWLVCAWQGHWMMHPAAWLVPRAISDQAGCWDESLSLNDDGEYFSRVVLASQGVRFCPGARSYYRSGINGSLSGRKTDLAWQSAFSSIEQSIQHLLAQEDSPRTRQVGANMLQRFIYEVYPNVPELRHQAALKVKHLGGATECPMGGPFFRALMVILGWERSKKLKNWVYKVGYQNLALGRLLASP